jgi:hypothetical protein
MSKKIILFCVPAHTFNHLFDCINMVGGVMKRINVKRKLLIVLTLMC